MICTIALRGVIPLPPLPAVLVLLLLLLAECDEDGRENLPPADFGGTFLAPAAVEAFCWELARVLTMRVKMATSCCSLKPVIVPTAVDGGKRKATLLLLLLLLLLLFVLLLLFADAGVALAEFLLLTPETAGA